MKPYILTLSDAQADLETTGGKGMSLAKMINAGLPVPDGFHVTTEAYRCFVSTNDIQTRILDAVHGIHPADPAELEHASQSISRLFAAGQIPSPIASGVAAAYARLKGAPVAVRSSATAEDLPDASFAGQQETYLNIQGEDAILEAIKKCWASLWTARAIAYRMKNNIDQNSIALAVVVQELVFADAAGIMFTANPINGKRDELVINAAWGLGEAIVSGLVTPDTITVQKDTSKVLHRETAEKSLMTIRTAQGTCEVPVPVPQRKKAALTDPQTAALARLGAKIEQFYQAPMDIEWTLAGGQFAIVQARPITALPLEWKVPASGVLYTRGSLAEHIPSPATPLFATLGLEIANGATEQMWVRIIGKDAKNLIVGAGYYQALNGYVYGGLRAGPKEILRLTLMSLRQIMPMFRGSVARWQASRQKLVAVVTAWERKPLENLSSSELIEGVRAVFGAACLYFTEIQTTLPVAAMSEIIFTRFYNSLIRRKQDPEATIFLLGSDTMALRAEKSLFDIAAWLKTEPVLASYILHTATENLLADLVGETAPAGLPIEAWAAWRQRFQTHLNAFGHSAYEFDFANPTPLETPAPLLDALKGFLAGKGSDPHERQREALLKRERAVQAVLERVGWPRKGWFRKLLQWAQETGPMREDSIFDMGMGHPLVRRIFGEMGRRLVAGGAIAQAEDIYWLEKSELEEFLALLEQGKAVPDVAGRIPERKAQWQAYLKITPPVMLPEKTNWTKLMHGGEAEKKDGKTVLKGVGTSGGKVTAAACVLYGPEDFGKMKPGDILIAVTTTPAWTPLFAMASAVVTDIGGPLSHSSIVAREYGIPAVMAARTATRAIQTGQLITVDGTAGTVTLE